MNDELHERMRLAAEDFEPDTDRMWDRVSAGMTAPDTVGARPIRYRFGFPYLAMATAAAVVLIAAIVSIGFRIAPQSPTAPPAAGPPSSDSSDKADDPGVRPTEETDETSEQPSAEVSETEGPPQRPEPVDQVDFVDVQASVDSGSNDWWSETDLQVEVAEPVSELTVELRVAGRDDLEFYDAWTTADHYFGQPDVSEEDGYLVLRWTLADGATVDPGEYTLAGQFNHDEGGRDTGSDYFVVEVDAASGSGQIVGDIAGLESGD